MNSFNHANGVLTLTTPATVNAIAGATISPAFSFTNSGANNDGLSIEPQRSDGHYGGDRLRGQCERDTYGVIVHGGRGGKQYPGQLHGDVAGRSDRDRRDGWRPASTATLTVNSYNHADAVSTPVTLALGNIHAGYSAASSNSFTVANGNNSSEDRVNLMGTARGNEQCVD